MRRWARVPPSHLFWFEGSLGARGCSCLGFPSPVESSLFQHFSERGSPPGRSLVQGDVPRDSTASPAREQRTVEKSSFYSHFPSFPLSPAIFKMREELGKGVCPLAGVGCPVSVGCWDLLLHRSLFKIPRQGKPKAPTTRCRQGRAWTHWRGASPARLQVRARHQGPLPAPSRHATPHSRFQGV